jgi:hypothetical protein
MEGMVGGAPSVHNAWLQKINEDEATPKIEKKGSASVGYGCLGLVGVESVVATAAHHHEMGRTASSSASALMSSALRFNARPVRCA